MRHELNTVTRDGESTIILSLHARLKVLNLNKRIAIWNTSIWDYHKIMVHKPQAKADRLYEIGLLNHASTLLYLHLETELISVR